MGFRAVYYIDKIRLGELCTRLKEIVRLRLRAKGAGQVSGMVENILGQTWDVMISAGIQSEG